MSEQYTPNLGEAPGPGSRRDAVHVAVAPVVSGQTPLYPGDHVGLAPDGRAGEGWTPLIGVVDPFRKECVREGESFWLFLYPGTVTSLRHVWSHPAFRPRLPQKEKDET